MSYRISRIVLLVSVFALATSIAGFAQAPCNRPDLVFCQAWDSGSNLFASQDDNVNGNGLFAQTYDTFTLSHTYDVTSLHWVGGFFNPPQVGLITQWTAVFYSDNNGVPGNPLVGGDEIGPGVGTFLGIVNGQYPMFEYDLYFNSVLLQANTPYWVSVVPDLGFPPQWGWATALGGPDLGYQCFFGTCGPTSTSFAFSLDNATPEPGTLIMLGTGVLGLAGTLRRKLSL